MTHLIRSVGLAVVLTALVFYPFFPGDVDVVAQTMSTTAQFVVLGGAIFLLPAGLWWLGRHLMRAHEQGSLAVPVRVPRVLVQLTLVALAVVGLLSALGAWMGGSPLMGIGVLSLSGIGVWQLRKRIASIDPRRTAATMAAYLIVVPVVGSVLQFLLFAPMTSFSRNRTMNQAAVLLAGIHRHYAEKAIYPDSLVALWPDFRPGIVGIPQYQYARHGNAYTLSFRQPSLVFPGFGREEVVVYNPRDEHLFPSHAAWALEWSMEQRMARQGWMVSMETGRPHWKYLWFD